MRSLIICTFVRYWYSKVKEGKVGGMCSWHQRENTCVQNFGKKT